MRGINYIEKKNHYSLLSCSGAEVTALCYRSTSIMDTISKIITGYAKYSNSPTSNNLTASEWRESYHQAITVVRNWWMPDGADLVFCKNHVLKGLPRRAQKISAHLIVSLLTLMQDISDSSSFKWSETHTSPSLSLDLDAHPCCTPKIYECPVSEGSHWCGRPQSNQGARWTPPRNFWYTSHAPDCP